MPTTVSVVAFRKLILELLPVGYPTIDQTARRFGIPVRTLQRRLHDTGCTYSELVDEVRFDAACRLLADPQARVAEVSVALGFTDPSNFSRAFARWTGLSPREYRCRQLGKRPKSRGQVPKRSGVK